MSVADLLKTAEFLVDTKGQKKTVMLDYTVWQEMLALLEDAGEIKRPHEAEEKAGAELPAETLHELAASIWVDKATLGEQMQQLMTNLGVQHEPIGAEALQKLMRDAQLAPNELSQSIIAAREE